MLEYWIKWLILISDGPGEAKKLALLAPCPDFMGGHRPPLLPTPLISIKQLANQFKIQITNTPTDFVGTEVNTSVLLYYYIYYRKLI